MKAFLIRGVPQNIQNDAWWMTAEAPQLDVPKPVQTKETSQGAWQSFALLGALIALGGRVDLGRGARSIAGGFPAGNWCCVTGAICTAIAAADVAACGGIGCIGDPAD